MFRAILILLATLPPLAWAQPDLSHLNHLPAGAHGRVVADGPDLVFADGTPARFWGVNVQAAALFRTEPEVIRHHAERLARHGINLVRIHHHDSHWVRPNVFGNRAPDTRTLDPASLARLDRWIGELKARGIYVWLDLHVGRTMTEDDQVADFDELAAVKPPGDIHGFNYVNDDIADRMEAFTTAYLTHKNPVTGLRYADDPAIIAVLITNENDLGHHYAARLLPDKGAPNHSARYIAAAHAFADRHGFDRATIWQFWQTGATRMFTAEMEALFFRRQIEAVRKTGFDGLVATTSTWGKNTVSALPSLTLGDVIDVHSYGGPGETRTDPRVAADMFTNIAAAQVAEMPLTVSEWNVPFPAEDRFIAPLRMGAMAAHQGWDALMLYGYAQQALDGQTRPGPWHAENDPALMTAMAAGALAYRLGHVDPARQTLVFDPGTDAFFGQKLRAATARAIRTGAEASALTVAMPGTDALSWLKPRSGTGTRITDPQADLLPPGPVTSDTGQIVRDPARGLYTVDTPGTRIIAGNLGGPVTLPGLSVDIGAPLAAIAVQSAGPEPIATSQSVLVTLLGPAAPAKERTLPFVPTPLSGTITFVAPADLTLKTTYQGVSHTADGDTHTLILTDAPGAQSLMLSR